MNRIRRIIITFAAVAAVALGVSSAWPAHTNPPSPATRS
jgi:hypothetical protein